MEKLKELLIQVEQRIPSFEQRNGSISEGHVGWHIAHILLSTSTIILALKRSKPEEFSSTFSLLRHVVFTLNKIPRGKAKAPKLSNPSEEITLEYLTKNMLRVKMLAPELKELDPKNHFNHPKFKTLDLKSSVKFINLHIKHHLKIIDEIIASTKN